MGLSACGEGDRDGDDSSYRQASLTDAEEESHRSFPEPCAPVLPKPGGILEKEHNAKQKSACEAKKEADKKAEKHNGGEIER